MVAASLPAAIAVSTLAVLLAIVGLALASATAHAGTWNIYPTITNATGSDAPNCPSGVSGGGCIVLESAGIVDGNWTSTPQGGNRGVASGNSDHPNFDAPHLAEGADGYWAYSMPDNSLFSVAVEDDQGVVDALNQAYVGCGLPPGKGPTTDGITCLATYPPGTNGEPSSSNFKPTVTFYSSISSDPPYTAAGQVCSTTSGSTLCGAGLQCAQIDRSKDALACHGQTAAPGVAQWSPTDPNNPMWLNFVNLGGSPVMMADLNVMPLAPPYGTGPNYSRACVMQNKGDTCAIMTSGGCSVFKAPNCGSDAIQIIPQNGWTSASVMVMQQAVITTGMAGNEDAEIDAAIESVIWNALTTVSKPSAPTPPVEGATVMPRITKLRASATILTSTAGSSRKPKAKKAKTQAVQVVYRNARNARSVLTFARERAGLEQGGRCVAATTQTKRRGGASCKRWVTLPGVATRTSTHHLWTPRGKGACPKGAKPGPKKGGRCQLRAELQGHQQHRDVAGVNRVTVSKINGKKLAAGRYRVSVRSLAGTVTSGQASATFRIGKAS